MNKFIYKELDKLDMSNTEKISDTHYIFHKQNKPYIQFELDHCYIIELADYIINPPPNFTLQDNWNKGVIPKSKYLRVLITQKMGKMNKVDGIGVKKVNDDFINTDDENYLGLWLPEAGMKLITEMR